MSYADYERLDALNWSTLKHILRSPAHFMDQRLHPSGQTEAFRIGQAFHCAALEPDRFAKEWVRVLDGVGRRSKEDKAKWAELEAKHPTAELLDADDYAMVTSMRDAVFANPQAAELLRSKGKAELVLVWKDPEFGVLCKCRIDWLTSWSNWTFIVDLKSCEDASEWDFGRSAAKYGYHRQGAFYARGARALANVDRRVVFIACEKKRPYGVACYEMDFDASDAAEAGVRRALRIYCECAEKNSWPGYESGLIPLRLPAWATQTREGE